MPRQPRMSDLKAGRYNLFTKKWIPARERVKRRKKKVPKALSLIKPSVNNYRALGLPNNLKLKLQYQYTPVTLSNAATAYSSYNLCINSLRDIDATGVGVQPPIFDNMMALYDRYRVLSAKVTCTWHSVGNTMYTYIKYVGNDNITDFSDFGVYNVGAGGNVIQGSSCNVNASGHLAPPLTKTFNLKRIEPDYMTDDDFTGTAAANPVKPLYVQFGQYNTSGAVNNLAYVMFKVDLVCEFSELNMAENADQD